MGVSPAVVEGAAGGVEVDGAAHEARIRLMDLGQLDADALAAVGTDELELFYESVNRYNLPSSIKSNSKGTHMRQTIAVLVGGLLMTATTIYAADPLIGTWKLNVLKSKLPKELADIKGEVKTFEAPTPDTIRTTSVFTHAHGETTRAVNTLPMDGRDHPATSRGSGKPMPNATMKYERPDPRHINGFFTRDGKPYGTMKWTVSEDGKTLTEFRTLSDGTEETDILDRQ